MKTKYRIEAYSRINGIVVTVREFEVKNGPNHDRNLRRHLRATKKKMDSKCFVAGIDNYTNPTLLRIDVAEVSAEIPWV